MIGRRPGPVGSLRFSHESSCCLEDIRHRDAPPRWGGKTDAKFARSIEPPLNKQLRRALHVLELPPHDGRAAAAADDGGVGRVLVDLLDELWLELQRLGAGGARAAALADTCTDAARGLAAAPGADATHDCELVLLGASVWSWRVRRRGAACGATARFKTALRRRAPRLPARRDAPAHVLLELRREAAKLLRAPGGGARDTAQPLAVASARGARRGSLCVLAQDPQGGPRPRRREKGERAAAEGGYCGWRDTARREPGRSSGTRSHLRRTPRFMQGRRAARVPGWAAQRRALRACAWLSRCCFAVAWSTKCNFRVRELH